MTCFVLSNLISSSCLIQDQAADLALLAHENLAMRLGRQASVGSPAESRARRALQKGPSIVGTRSLRRRASSASISGQQQQLIDIEDAAIVGGEEEEELLTMLEVTSTPLQRRLDSPSAVTLRRLASPMPPSPRSAAAPAALAFPAEVREAPSAAGTVGGRGLPRLGRGASVADMRGCLMDLTSQTSSMVSQLKVSPDEF